MKSVVKLSNIMGHLPEEMQEHIKDLGIDIENAEVHRKGVSDTQEGIDEEMRVVTRYVSTRRIDRDAEIMMPKGCILTDFKKGKRVPVLWCHNYTQQLGSDNWIKADEYGVKAESKYVIPSENSGAMGGLANYVWDMITQGHLQANSVGFIPIDVVEKGAPGWDKLTNQLAEKWAEPVSMFEGAKRIIKKWLLLEHSDVPVPSNVHAINLAVQKGYDVPSECKEAVKQDDDPAISLLDSEWVSSADLPPEKTTRPDTGTIAISKGVIPYRDLGKAPEDEKWSGPAEVREADIDDLKLMSTWWDTAKPEVKGSYKLPHHKAAGGHVAVWAGVRAAMGALLGARGGVDVPGGDRKGIYNHLVKHYNQFDKEPPALREYSEEELQKEFPPQEELPEPVAVEPLITERVVQQPARLVQRPKERVIIRPVSREVLQEVIHEEIERARGRV